METRMRKRPLSTIETHIIRGMAFVGLLFIAINLVQGQPLSSRVSEINSGRRANGTRTVVRVHDTAQRPQIVSPQQNHSVASSRPPSGSICGVESRAAHGQIAPNTNGGTLNPVAFINPTTVNASGRVAFNSEVNGSARNQGVFVADSDGTISAIAIGCGGVGGSGDTTLNWGGATPLWGQFGGVFFCMGFSPPIKDVG